MCISENNWFVLYALVILLQRIWVNLWHCIFIPWDNVFYSHRVIIITIWVISTTFYMLYFPNMDTSMLIAHNSSRFSFLFGDVMEMNGESFIVTVDIIFPTLWMWYGQALKNIARIPLSLFFATGIKCYKQFDTRLYLL